MFKCESCNKQVAEKTPQHSITIKTRKKHYPKRYANNGPIIDNGGDGFEIVRELKVCQTCHDEHTAAAVPRAE